MLLFVGFIVSVVIEKIIVRVTTHKVTPIELRHLTNVKQCGQNFLDAAADENPLFGYYDINMLVSGVNSNSW